MEESRSALPVLPCGENPPRAADGGKLVFADLRQYATRRTSVLLLKRRQEFWRDPRIRFVVTGAFDAYDAIEFCDGLVQAPPGYWIHRAEVHPFDDASLVVTLHCKVDTFGAK